MRLLLIMNYRTELSSQQFQERQNRLYAMAKTISGKVSTYVFAEEEKGDHIKSLSLNGHVFYQGFGQVSADLIVSSLLKLMDDEGFASVIVDECELANDVTVLLAAQKDLPFLTNINGISYKAGQLELTRDGFDNNLILQHKLPKESIISLHGIDCRGYESAQDPVDFKALAFVKEAAYITSQRLQESAQERRQAPILIAVGMGVGTREEVEKIKKFAGDNGFGFGVTRPIAMHGWASISDIIGVSGNTFTPKICITIGVSGAAAFYTGVADSDYILSINSNQDAPIVEQSDWVICDDYKNVSESLFAALKKLAAKQS